MKPAPFDAAAIEAFLDAAAASLTGEWLLVGGAAAATWFSPGRVTEDIDLIGLDGSRDERMALMDLAEAQGLPLEAVNSAAGYFLHRIENWRDELEPLRSGGAIIHRPTPTLFLLLKIGRLSETDLSDCMALLEHVAAHGGSLDAPRVRAALAALAPSCPTADHGLAARRQFLDDALRQRQLPG